MNTRDFDQIALGATKLKDGHDLHYRFRYLHLFDEAIQSFITYIVKYVLSSTQSAVQNIKRSSPISPTCWLYGIAEVRVRFQVNVL